MDSDEIANVSDVDDDPAGALGPIQMMSVAFDGNRFRGEILPELDRLKAAGIVRIVDLLLVRKDALGNTMVTTASDLEWEEATSIGAFFGALSGFVEGGTEGFDRGAIAGAAAMADGHLFDEDDVFSVTQVLPPNMSAALVLFEHLWAVPFLDAVSRAGGVELLNTWLRPEAVMAAAHGAAAPPRLG